MYLKKTMDLRSDTFANVYWVNQENEQAFSFNVHKVMRLTHTRQTLFYYFYDSTLWGPGVDPIKLEIL